MPRRNTGPRLKWLEKRKSWYIVWYEAGRERSRATGSTEQRAAEDALAEFIQERRIAERPSRPSEPDQVLIADVLELYTTLHAPNAKDPARISYAVDALLPFWGDKHVADITKQACGVYRNRRRRAPGTIRRELGTLRAALNFAVEEKRLTVAPTVALPDKPEGKDRWLTRSEAAKLLSVARTGRADTRLYLPLFIVIGLYTGARKAAILSLRWPQVDLQAGRIDFRTPGEVKTNKRKARIPIPRPLLTMLRLARQRGSDLGYVVHDKGRRIIDIGDSRNGSFGRACTKAGLAGVSPHTLRHTCGTWLAQRGVDLWDIAGWLGQSHTTTVELYSHHHPDYMDSAKDALERRGNRK